MFVSAIKNIIKLRSVRAILEFEELLCGALIWLMTNSVLNANKTNSFIHKI